ncbi:uncharacterized protein At4g17910 isoform X2 [Eurytemora carolleeae]|uniref:uncharacterized protein At4g17910 isoform X2 n=1 Tax=Eurytemora carolleeae TaxID=1294199 RepID=UPI000C78873B|nr:uncharacterized protein At4g17910 isoform X2 [Eurytemora carolleeae]|eukprot:XP_023324861.1 uncharacterized protein At4g17910-like isoform X2 [Eurytemora affinis]
MDPVYQEKHRQFVASNNGSTIPEIIVAGLSLHLSPLLVGLISLLPWWSSTLPWRTLELFIILIPPLLSLTILAESPEVLNLSLAVASILVLLVIISKKKGSRDVRRLWDFKLTEDGILCSILNFRSSMLLVTAICILAVDFPVFPRKFGKTETYGYGLMDLGVGGFVFAAGLTSSEGRRKECSLFKTVKSCFPLLILGAFRLIVLSWTGYHTNITEYGKHWNFFFTLFSVKVLGSLVIPLIPVDWLVLDGPREGLLDSNREGIFSVAGFLAIYLAGVSWARGIIHTPFTFTTLVNVLQDVIVWSILMWFSLLYSTTFFLPPSRRFANYTFFTFVIAYNLSILAGFMVIEAAILVLGEWRNGSSGESNKKMKKERKEKKSRPIIPKKEGAETEASISFPRSLKGLRSPELFQAISYNSLPYFLLANLLTGCVNGLIPTLEVEGCRAVLILLLYLLILSIIFIILHTRRIKLIVFYKILLTPFSYQPNGVFQTEIFWSNRIHIVNLVVFILLICYFVLL